MKLKVILETYIDCDVYPDEYNNLVNGWHNEYIK
jgi:hypothetical protein